VANSQTQLTLDEAVAEVLGLLTGLDLQYQPEQDRYGAVVRAINRALRSNALEQEWSYYASVEQVNTAHEGSIEVLVDEELRPRIIGDDAVRLVDANGQPLRWAYFLPRDALHKYRNRLGLWVSVTRDRLTFSRPFDVSEEGLGIEVPVMREPEMFRLPAQPEDPGEALIPVPQETRDQLVDFWYPDLIVVRAAFYYAQTDPIMQPRVQTIEAQYKDLMYQIMERDKRNTDAPTQNDFVLEVQSDLNGPTRGWAHGHPHSNAGWGPM